MKSWALIVLLTAATPAHALPAFLNDILLLADSPPQITTAYLDKTKYQLGDQMLITAETTDDWGTKKISAEIQTEKGTETTNLILIAGNSRKGTYQGAWKVHDTIGEKEYKTKIIATDLSGQTTEKTLVWTDPTQDHPASEITPGTFQAGNYGLQGRLYASDPTSTTFGTVGPYTAAFGTSPITGITGDSNTYTGYFSGGKGVKISGNLEVTGTFTAGCTTAICKYDFNKNGAIEKNEAAQAVLDYFDGVITKTDATTVANAYKSNYVLGYDSNSNGLIDKSEAVKAVFDYFGGTITKDEAVQVVLAYQNSLAISSANRLTCNIITKTQSANTVKATCNSDEFATGGGCEATTGSGGIKFDKLIPSTGGYECTATGAGATIKAYAICCK